MPEKEKSRFQRSLGNPDEFTLTFELVPSRGGRSREHTRALALARAAIEDGRLQAVSITENAGGHSALSPEILGMEIQSMGLDVIVHLSCKDKNRNQMESLLFAWDRMGLRNLLVITGDYPKKGYRGDPKPVFDLGSIHALDLLARMNEGQFGADKLCQIANPTRPTAFRKGGAVSPFKRSEAELAMQYYKLARKVANGADYVITQVGYDARKFEEVLLFMRDNDLRVPLLGNVFIPNLTVNGLMHRGEIPGIVIADSLHRRMIDEAAAADDRGRKARLRRAAKLLCVLKGLGYDGAHIGGPCLTFDDLRYLLDTAEELADDWRDFLGELAGDPGDFYYWYALDRTTGLNIPGQTARPDPVFRRLTWYDFMRGIHNLAFDPGGLLYGPMKKSCLWLDRSRLRCALAKSEHISKFLLFGCQNCGDCTLAEEAFLCPQSGCAKYLLNGPCGGSRDGWCEVYPGEKRCFYVRVYERLRAAGEEDRMRRGFVPPRDWALNNTSSWVNFFQGRDHAGRGG